MTDNREEREKLLALEQQAEALRRTVQRLNGEPSVHQERCALAAKASDELTAALAQQAERREALAVTLRRLHDLVHARLVRRGDEATVLEERLNKALEKQSRQND